jgi:hypothetical protein
MGDNFQLPSVTRVKVLFRVRRLYLRSNVPGVNLISMPISQSSRKLVMRAPGK